MKKRSIKNFVLPGILIISLVVVTITFVLPGSSCYAKSFAKQINVPNPEDGEEIAMKGGTDDPPPVELDSMVADDPISSSITVVNADSAEFFGDLKVFAAATYQLLGWDSNNSLPETGDPAISSSLTNPVLASPSAGSFSFADNYSVAIGTVNTGVIPVYNNSLSGTDDLLTGFVPTRINSTPTLININENNLVELAIGVNFFGNYFDFLVYEADNATAIASRRFLSNTTQSSAAAGDIYNNNFYNPDPENNPNGEATKVYFAFGTDIAKTYILNSDLDTEYDISIDQTDSFIASPAMADLNGNGLYEVIITSKGNTEGYDGRLHILKTENEIDGFGYPVHNWSHLVSDEPEGLIYASPAIGNLDAAGNPDLEIIVATTNGFVYAFNLDSEITLRWSTQIPGADNAISATPLIADIDKSVPGKETIIYTKGRKIYVLNANGELLPGLSDDWMFDTGYGPYGSNSFQPTPALIDLDLDGDLELLVAADDEILVFELPSDTTEDDIEWGQFRNTIGGTGVYERANRNIPIMSIDLFDGNGFVPVPPEGLDLLGDQYSNFTFDVKAADDNIISSIQTQEEITDVCESFAYSLEQIAGGGAILHVTNCIISTEGNYPLHFVGTDEHGLHSEPALLTIYAGEAPPPPFEAYNDPITIWEDAGSTPIAVTANDEGVNLEIIDFTQPLVPGQGDVLQSGTTLIYTPPDNFNTEGISPVRFSYTIIQQGAPEEERSAYVDVTVNSVNDAPTITIEGLRDPAEYNEGELITFDAVGFDPDGQSDIFHVDIDRATMPEGLVYDCVYNNATKRCTFSWQTGHTDAAEYSPVFEVIDLAGASNDITANFEVLDFNQPPVFINPTTDITVNRGLLTQWEEDYLIRDYDLNEPLSVDFSGIPPDWVTITNVGAVEDYPDRTELDFTLYVHADNDEIVYSYLRDPHEYTVTLEATDEEDTGSTSVDIYVNAPPEFSINNTELTIPRGIPMETLVFESTDHDLGLLSGEQFVTYVMDEDDPGNWINVDIDHEGWSQETPNTITLNATPPIDAEIREYEIVLRAQDMNNAEKRITITLDVVESNSLVKVYENSSLIDGYDTIQEAVAFCSGDSRCADGDCSIEIEAGIYFEHIDFPDDFPTITIKPSDDTGTPVTIDGAGGGGAVIEIPNSAGTITLERLIIQNGALAFHGGGISATNSSLSISESIIRNNAANSNGGGISLVNASEVLISGCTIQDNAVSTASGGGIYIDEGSNISIIDSIIQDNVAVSAGGGIAVYDSTSVDNPASVLVEGTHLINNIASNKPSSNSMFHYNSDTRITDCSFRQDSGADDSGGNTCFLKGTQILLADGTNKSIEKLNVGEIVLGIDENKNIVQAPITETFVHKETSGYLVIKTEDKNKIRATTNHPIHKGNEFVEAGTLKVGDLISILDEKTNQLKETKIIKIKKRPWSRTVYNIEVDEIHTYIAEGIIVHNKNVGGKPHVNMLR